MKRTTLLAAALGMVVLTAGCIGGSQNDDVQQTKTIKPKEITKEAEKRFQEITSVIPLNYTIPGQQLLEKAVVWFNDTVDSAADASFESPKDEGGNNFMPVYKTFDLGKLLPAGQPAKVQLTLFWRGNPGSSADLDIFVDVPGLKTDHDGGDSQSMNWNIPVKRKTFVTVGVPGQNHLVGVQASEGRIAPGEQLPFAMEITVSYARDVLTPYHPYAFTVPQGASGIILESDKVGGSDHVKAKFVVIDPLDELVQYVEYNDIDIPSESIFVPTTQAGEYIFYAFAMEGGFLALKADVPVEENLVRILPRVEERIADFSDPMAPGVAEHTVQWDAVGQTIVTPGYREGRAAAFAVDKSFPLWITSFIDGGQVVTGDVQIRISSAKGLVHDYVRTARVDGDQGRLGFSGETAPFVFHDPSMLSKGSYTISQVVNGNGGGAIGHSVLTYQR